MARQPYAVTARGPGGRGRGVECGGGRPKFRLCGWGSTLRPLACCSPLEPLSAASSLPPSYRHLGSELPFLLPISVLLRTRHPSRSLQLLTLPPALSFPLAPSSLTHQTSSPRAASTPSLPPHPTTRPAQCRRARGSRRLTRRRSSLPCLPTSPTRKKSKSLTSFLSFALPLHHRVACLCNAIN